MIEMTNNYHTKLLGLTDKDLIAICPEATHQHYKGGLYRLVGFIKPKNSELEEIAIVRHLYPHTLSEFYILKSEFNEIIDNDVDRYRLIGFN